MKHMTNNYQFAGICVEITYTDSYFTDLAKDYEGGTQPAISIVATAEDIEMERKRIGAGEEYNGYLESLVIYRKLCEKLVQMNVLLVHSAAIAVDGKAYLFTAPSGTGKTTHIKLWQEKFGEKAVIINGDKPLISINPDEIRVWGTPWAGKEQWSTNTSAEVAGICYIHRGEKNEIKTVPANEALTWLYAQTYRPTSAEGMQQTLQLLMQFAARVPAWKLKCNMSLEAADVSYAAMRGE